MFLLLDLSYSSLAPDVGEFMFHGTSARARGGPMENTRLEHVEAGVVHVGGGDFTSPQACEV